MTDDDDLTRDLEAWAAATDPATDPITATEVTDAPTVSIRRPRSRRPRLAVAAALLVVLGLGAALAVTADDGTDEVVTDTTEPTATGARTQIIVTAPDLDPAWTTTLHRFSLIGPDDEGVTGPLLPGTSLIVDRPLAAGRWDLSVLTYDCGQTSVCDRPNVDGTPEADIDPIGCDVSLAIGTESSRQVLRVESGEGTGPTCSGPLTSLEVPPPLTVPPAWSVRPELPWSCGNGTFDAHTEVADDPPAKREAFACFRDAVADGTPVEVPVVELAGGDDLVRSWWRTLPEPIDGDRFEVIRERGLDGARGWVRARCHGVDIEEGDADVTTPEGGITGYRYTASRPTGCTEEEPLALDLPPLDGPAPAPGPTTTTATTTTTAPPTTTAPEDGVAVDVVLDLQPPATDDGEVQWWSLDHADSRIAQALAGAPITPGGPRQVALVADDVRIAPTDRWSLTSRRAPCHEGLCPSRGPDGRPRDGRVHSTGCTNDLPTDLADGAVLIVTLVDEGCSTTVAETMPALTVPPAWSLRERLLTPCGIPGTPGVDEDDDAIAGRTEEIRRCFVDAVLAGDELEMRSPKLVDEDAPDGRSWRHVDGTVTVVGHGDPVTGEGWTSQTCGSIVEISEEPYMQGTSCGPVEPLPLTP